MKRLALALLTLLLVSAPAFATDYHIGPGQAYTTIGAVPWYTLGPGDTVNIHCKSPNTPYFEKFNVGTRGTALAHITVQGVSCAGAKPIISGNGATTGTNMHFHYTTPSLIQALGVVQITPVEDQLLLSGFNVPAYIDIKNLEIQDVSGSYTFTAENGSSGNVYNDFSACIYARMQQHVLIENVTFHNCNLGFFNATGNVDGGAYYEALAKDVTIRGSYFYNNGAAGAYTLHPVYVQAQGCTIEYNHFGPPKAGMFGNQIKSRCSGDVIRDNYIEGAPQAYMLDLVEVEDASSLCASNLYKQTFVYGNIFLNNTAGAAFGNGYNNFHWNEDHQVGTCGRATVTGGTLVFYDNTWILVADADTDFSGVPDYIFNVHYGAFDCNPVTPGGTIKLYNNIFYSVNRTMGHAAVPIKLGRCSSHFTLGKNWINGGWTTGVEDYASTTSTGDANMVSPGGSPSFTVALTDLHLLAMSSARGIGGALPSEVTINYLGLNLTPTRQYRYDLATIARSDGGITDVGAFSDSDAPVPTPPVTNRDVIPEPTLPTFGAAGSIIVDPSFGTRILRVTDANTLPSSIGSSHGTPSASHTLEWNSTSTRFFMRSTAGGQSIWNFDAVTMQATRTAGSGDGGLQVHFDSNDLQWSWVDPDIIFTSTNDPAHYDHPIVEKFNVVTQTYTSLISLGAIPNLPIGTGRSYLHALYGSQTAPERLAVIFGGPDGQDSDMFIAVFEVGNPSNVRVVDSLNSQIYINGAAGVATSSTLGFKMHSAQIDRTGRYAILETTTAYSPPKSAKYAWDLTNNTFTAIEPYGAAHTVTGWGDFINQHFPDQTPYDNAQWTYRTLADVATHRQLIRDHPAQGEIYVDGHTTWHNALASSLQPVFTELYRAQDCLNDTPHNTAAFRAWDNELIGIETANSGPTTTVSRYAHHRSIVCDDTNTNSVQPFYYEPRPNISPDGRWLLFTSNWGKSLGTAATGMTNATARFDLFMVEIPGAPSAPPAPSTAVGRLGTQLPR